jgi:hypothetical protein
MGGPRRDRERRSARRIPTREPKPCVLVVCEGAVTEPGYIKGFTTVYRNPLVTVVIASQHGRDPKALVEIAKEHKEKAANEALREDDENLVFERVWCVFDVNSHNRIPEAVQQAIANGIDLAISNPCIEIWLLLHFTDYSAIQGRKQVKAQLKAHLPDYDKRIDFAKDFAANYDEAVERAKRLDTSATALHRGHHEHIPCTGFFQLTESLK